MFDVAMSQLKYLIPLLALAGCGEPVCNPCGGGKQSDAQVTFSARGQHYVIADYSIYPAGSSMNAWYYPYDSTLKIMVYGPLAPGSNDVRLSFFVRALPYRSQAQYGLPDTGTFLLNLEVTLDSSLFCPPLEGSASVTLWSDSNPTDHTWFTDSKHTGTLRITQIDTVNNLFSGTFNFLAVDTSMADTVRIDNGVIYIMRIR